MNKPSHVLALLLFAGIVAAQSESTAPSFAALDADADGRISAAEAQADQRVVERFREADLDRDGYLSAEEFKAAWH